jgi:hypothetical protein
VAGGKRSRRDRGSALPARYLRAGGRPRFAFEFAIVKKKITWFTQAAAVLLTTTGRFWYPCSNLISLAIASYLIEIMRLGEQLSNRLKTLEIPDCAFAQMLQQ